MIKSQGEMLQGWKIKFIRKFEDEGIPRKKNA